MWSGHLLAGFGHALVNLHASAILLVVVVVVVVEFRDFDSSGGKGDMVQSF